MAPNSFLLCTLMLISLSLSFHTIFAEMKYLVHNLVPTNPGGIRFEKEFGIPSTIKMMKKHNGYLWYMIFKQTKPADRKPVNTVEAFIKVIDRPGVSGETWEVSKININVDLFRNHIDYPGGFTLKQLFSKLMLHEMGHVFQWNGEGKCPGGLTEGIADYAVLKANITGSYPQAGLGIQWDDGYAVTARFLEYCDGLVPDFTSKLNNMMRKTYDVSFFMNLTGKPVDVLWKEYKAKYPGVSPIAV